jgi:hypothetical protein
MIGFVVLARRAPGWTSTGRSTTCSRRRPPGRQLPGADAGHRGLLDVRKFDAFNRMSAFVVHDLKNIVTSCR